MKDIPFFHFRDCGRKTWAFADFDDEIRATKKHLRRKCLASNRVPPPYATKTQQKTVEKIYAALGCYDKVLTGCDGGQQVGNPNKTQIYII